VLWKDRLCHLNVTLFYFQNFALDKNKKISILSLVIFYLLTKNIMARNNETPQSAEDFFTSRGLDENGNVPSSSDVEESEPTDALNAAVYVQESIDAAMKADEDLTLDEATSKAYEEEEVE